MTCASPLRPDSLYGVSKLLAERMLETLLCSRFVVLRLFFPFGPGQRPARLIPRMIHRIARGEPIEINTDLGYPIINPIYINDLVNQVVQIVDNPIRTCYNLGGETSYSIRELAESIARHLDTKPNFVVLEKKAGNLMCKPDLPGAGQHAFEEHLSTTIRSVLADGAA